MGDMVAVMSNIEPRIDPTPYWGYEGLSTWTLTALALALTAAGFVSTRRGRGLRQTPN